MLVLFFNLFISLRIYFNLLLNSNFSIAIYSIHRSNETYKNYAKFEGLSTDILYKLTVYSSKEEGLSTEYSTIFVPNESDSEF